MSLAGKLIVVTRGAVGSLEWQQKLTALGASVYNLPTIVMSPVPADAETTKWLYHVNEYDWLVFTSSSGIRYLHELSAQLGINLALMNLPKIAVVGSQTARTAVSAGFRVSFEPSVSDSTHLANELNIANGERVLLLRTTIASDELPVLLKQRGAHITDRRIYKTELLKYGDPEFSRLLKDGKIDYITFASPSAVAGFKSRLSKEDFALTQQLPVVSIGSSVTTALQQAKFTNVHTAKSASLDGVIKTLQQLSA